MPPAKLQKQQDFTRRSSVTFATGVLAGAATSTLVPWEIFEGMAPTLRLAAVAALCAAFVLFRLIFAGSEARKATAIVMVSVGGLLISGGAKIMSGALAISPVAVGAVLFLFGVTLLMRERRMPSHLREAAVGRLLEDSNGDTENEDCVDDVDATPSIERLRALELLAETDPKSPSGTVRVQ
jgi:hypothetical protein